MTIFFLLNGMGLVFLLYVLANFWKEGHRPENATRQFSTALSEGSATSVFVLTRPISHSAGATLSAVPMQISGRGTRDNLDAYRSFVEEIEADAAPVGTRVNATRFSAT